ncbi:MAG: GNAT family N-acetyltransferase [Spirochaetes bacterium]|nr:GNAT family N-acetyltransferase [Spirochaetota bacterium]
MERRNDTTEYWRNTFPEKFAPEEKIFCNIRRGDRIFISTACGEPQYLIQAMVAYIENHPKAFAETEVMHVWTLGVAPYADQKFTYNFRHNSFFVSDNTRNSVNTGMADYTPIFLSRIPELFRKRMIPIDVAMIQISTPDRSGYVSLGISVDITKTAMETAKLVIAQMNPHMPRVHGNTFVHIRDIDYIVYREEELLEYNPNVPSDIAIQIGKYVSRIVNDGDTIQVGYGSMPNAILNQLHGKKHLGLHSELLTDAIVDLIDEGVIDNSRKSIDRGKSVASFCMATKKTYDFIDDNPSIEFREISYTNNPLIIAQNNNMTAINAALQIDLTGQATAESIGNTYFSGIGGSADFMRGALLSPGGRTILVLQSTAQDGKVSRIVPFLDSGTGVTLNRGDLCYVITEYGIAYIHGKNIRERAMDLISIAHPKFRPWLIEEAKRLNIIYRDQAFIPGKKGEYPEQLETVRTTKKGFVVRFRPVRINDETLIKDLFYKLSDTSLRRRFMSPRLDVPHQIRQEFVIIDYTKEMVILAVIVENNMEIAVGMGQLSIDEEHHTAEVAFAVRDDYHNRGIGSELLDYLTVLAKRKGLQGFTAEVLAENLPMLHVFESKGFDMTKRIEEGVYELIMQFGDRYDEN